MELWEFNFKIIFVYIAEYVEKKRARVDFLAVGYIARIWVCKKTLKKKVLMISTVLQFELLNAPRSMSPSMSTPS